MGEGGTARSADAIVGAVQAAGLLTAPERGPLLLMCSAGRDSACLLDVAVRVVGAARLHVLHVDHGLRGAQAGEDDAACVRAWGAAHGVPVTVRAADAETAPGRLASADGEPGSGRRPGNLHAWARAERQRLADEVAGGVGAVRIATAHTRTDLVETALGRLATQPGRRALLAMRAQEGRLVRPLLAAGITREETADYGRARGLVWREDPSNASGQYARARLRHGVLPVLRSLNPRAEDAIARTLEELAAESEVIDALVDAELGRGSASANAAVGVAVCEAGGPAVELERLAELPAPLARLVLRELCERTLGEPCPRAASRLDDVLALSAGAAGRAGTGAVDVGSGARVQVRAGLVRCVRSDGPAAPYTPPRA